MIKFCAELAESEIKQIAKPSNENFMTPPYDLF
jgi:hypothetical protein